MRARTCVAPRACAAGAQVLAAALHTGASWPHLAEGSLHGQLLGVARVHAAARQYSWGTQGWRRLTRTYVQRLRWSDARLVARGALPSSGSCRTPTPSAQRRGRADRQDTPRACRRARSGAQTPPRPGCAAHTAPRSLRSLRQGSQREGGDHRGDHPARRWAARGREAHTQVTIRHAGVQHVLAPIASDINSSLLGRAGTVPAAHRSQPPGGGASRHPSHPHPAGCSATHLAAAP